MPLSLPAELELNHRSALLEPCAAAAFSPAAAAAARATRAVPEQTMTGRASRNSAPGARLAADAAAAAASATALSPSAHAARVTPLSADGPSLRGLRRAFGQSQDRGSSRPRPETPPSDWRATLAHVTGSRWAGPPPSREGARLSSCFPEPHRHLKKQYRGRAERRSRDGSCSAERRSHLVLSPGSQAPNSKKPWRALPPSPVW